MAEKVQSGRDGFHFPVGNSVALAELLRSLARDRDKAARLRRTMRYPDLPEVTADQHIALYNGLLQRHAAA
jgi:hypothetical protein